MDPLADKAFGKTPYNYCSNNPLCRIDPDGKKDKKFVPGKDKPIDRDRVESTETRVYIEKGNRRELLPNRGNAYNCHSYTWHKSQGDPTDPRNKPLLDIGVKKWDQSPSDDLKGYRQLSQDEANKKGDNVIYFIDKNGDNKYEEGEEIVHSAIVRTVDKDGNTTTVESKMGQGGLSENHPNAPGYYGTTTDGKQTNRAYFRRIKK